MAFTRKALKARAKVRRAGMTCGYRELLLQGERGYQRGESNPYEVGTEDHAIWQEGWKDAESMTQR